MLSFLSARENGTHRPSALSRAEATRRIFSLELSKDRDVQRIHDSGVNTLDIDPVEGRYLLSGGTEGVIVICDLECRPQENYTCPSVCTIGRSSRHVHKYSVDTVQWYSHDTGLFTSSSMDKTLKVWDTNALKPADVFRFETIVYDHNMSSVATKHCLIAVGTIHSQVVLCDLKSGSSTHVLRGHKASVLSVKWSPRDEFLLASGSRDSKIMLWDVRRAKSCLSILDQHNGEKGKGSTEAVNTAHNGHVNGLSFTSDGLYLVSFGTDDRLRLWDTMSGKNTLVNYGKVDNVSRKGSKFTVSYGGSPDVAFVPMGSNIAVFDIYTGEYVATLIGHYNNVNCCTFHPLYQELYSAGNDSNILIWEPELGQKTDVAEKKDNKQSSSTVGNAVQDTWSDED
ncbi:DNA excision repair protein ERCC-8-like [Saccoglossus kowalevskii]|uniref:DNA excision repair protein ERCC-8-like n=1 Tax=Saccoglossus kowalevskii TaxID=10224 RepID=A0ABM0GN72_SACKO|nr:PREDICTED: DNA excision repair protein ERCC-8-like [Saccoglossus kowalevskii]